MLDEGLHYNKYFKKNEKHIFMGECYTSCEDIVITTTLGSCVSVAIFDTVLKIGGMNHFMLPEQVSDRTNGDVYLSDSGKYGMQAIETLINCLQKKGGKRRDFVARIFGGSRINSFRHRGFDVGAENINFAFRFMADEKIPVISYDVYGCLPRRVSFFTKTSKTVVKYIIDESEASRIRQNMHLYHRKIRQQIPLHEMPVLFDL